MSIRLLLGRDRDRANDLSHIGNGDPSGNLQAVGTVIAKVGTSSATLTSTLQAACPSG